MKAVVDVAKDLARAHRAEDPETRSIFLAENDVEVRLVEVTGSIASAGEVLPFHFLARPDQGVPYPSAVILLSEEDWRLVEAGKLALPEGWGPPEALKKIA
jgi:hypothetical protein